MSSLQSPSPGLVLDGRYRLAARIGGGGMGDVYRAVEMKSGRAVAIKLLRPELAQNDDVALRFFQEATAVSRIHHPNVVELLEAGACELGPFIVMEHLEGESIGAVLARRGSLSPEAACATILPVLDALEAAHRAGIIHRDLKPENVFLSRTSSKASSAGEAASAGKTERGEVIVRLLDFGIAKVLDQVGPTPHTRTGVVFGTPDYLSPEQATGDKVLDGRSDLFAVGVLLYELLTGTRPFRAATAVATAFRVVHGEAAPLAAIGVDIDARIEAVVSRLLQKDPSARFQTAAEVMVELEAIAPDVDARRAALSSLSHARFASREPNVLHAREIEAVARDPAPGAKPAPAFPERFRGQFQVRGAALRAVDEALRERFGRDARDSVLARLPAPYSDQLREKGADPRGRYPLEIVEGYIALATEAALVDVECFRALGRRAVDGALSSMLRPAMRAERDLAASLRRGADVVSRLLDFSQCDVHPLPDGRVEVRLSKLEPTSRALRLWLVGVIEQTAWRAASGELSCRISSGDASHAAELRCEIGRV